MDTFDQHNESWTNTVVNEENEIWTAKIVKQEPIETNTWTDVKPVLNIEPAQQQVQQQVQQEQQYLFSEPNSNSSPNLYIKSEFIPQLEFVPPLTCKSEYTPAFTQHTEFKPVFATGGALNYSSDFPLVQTQLRKESWEEDSEDDEGLEGEDREAVKARRKLRKMNREKQKRSCLNDKFEDLCSMLSLGRTTRVEKLKILTETIKYIDALSKENRELQQSTHSLRHEVHCKKGGVPTLEQAPAAHYEQPTTTPAFFDQVDTSTDFCMDIDDLTLWEDDSVSHTKLFSESVKLECDETSSVRDASICVKAEEFFCEDDADVDSFFNNDDTFNPNDFSFTAF